MKIQKTERPARGTRRREREGLEISLKGLRISLGRAGVVIIASGVAAILYALARGPSGVRPGPDGPAPDVSVESRLRAASLGSAAQSRELAPR